MSAASYPSPPTSSGAGAKQNDFVAGLLVKNASFSEHADPKLLAACAKGQQPKAFWLGCSDSRVAEAPILQAQLGEVFVHRNIANVFDEKDTSALAAMTYALRNLGASHVLVVGHSSCGGCAAALSSASASAPPSTSSLDSGDQAIVSWITPLISLAKSLASKAGGGGGSDPLATLVESNVARSVQNVAASEVVQGLWRAGRDIYVHGLVYDLGTGKLRDLGLTQGPPGKV